MYYFLFFLEKPLKNRIKNWIEASCMTRTRKLHIQITLSFLLWPLKTGQVADGFFHSDGRVIIVYFSFIITNIITHPTLLTKHIF